MSAQCLSFLLTWEKQIPVLFKPLQLDVCYIYSDGVENPYIAYSFLIVLSYMFFLFLI